FFFISSLHPRCTHFPYTTLFRSWLEEGRNPFYQGLLQVAVGLFHFRRENINGAKKLFASALSKLQPYPDRYMGIDLGRLRREVEDRKSTRLNSSHVKISYAVFCL